MSRFRNGQLVRYSDHYREQHCIPKVEPHQFGVVIGVEFYETDGLPQSWPSVMWIGAVIPSLCHPLNVTKVLIVEHKDIE